MTEIKKEIKDVIEYKTVIHPKNDEEYIFFKKAEFFKLLSLLAFFGRTITQGMTDLEGALENEFEEMRDARNKDGEGRSSDSSG